MKKIGLFREKKAICECSRSNQMLKLLRRPKTEIAITCATISELPSYTSAMGKGCWFSIRVAETRRSYNLYPIAYNSALCDRFFYL